ncbi:hypothetical protein JCM8547_007509 [Rhodosporidiobolus lusitaniae]
MSWRGGAHPPSAFSHPSSSTNNPTSAFSSSSASTSTSPFGFPASASSSVGRGRGRGRGAASFGGGAGGRAGGASSSLSWRADQAAEGGGAEGGEGSDHGAAAAAAAAKSVFGDFSSGGSAFGAFGAGGGLASGVGREGGAFGGGGSAFGCAGVFGGNGGKSAFPSSLTSTSALGSTSAFGSTSTPLFRPVSTDAEENGGTGENGEADEGEPSTVEEEEEEDNIAQPAQPVARAAGQISTLEVLGEDSDARKKRFEATLPNNRYLELKPLREAERLQAIKDGLIPDPSKPMRLDEATDFEGTCEEMCPEWEREEREYQNNVDPLERYPGTSRIDPSRAVKAFHRPAAGNDAPLPGDVRPPRVLHSTLNYLFHDLLPTLPLHVTHPFLRDRTRSIRQDFTVQNVRGKSAVECNERIARYHILALGVLREQSGFSESQELEQLRKVLKSLNEFYDDARLTTSSSTPMPFPNEPEFRAYNLLTHLRDPDIIWSTELLPPSIFSHPLLRTALSLSRLAQKSKTARGERASLNAFSRFFKLVSSPEVPYLFGCILSTHFNEIRRNAIEALRGAYLKQHSSFPLRTLAKVLGCDGEEEAKGVCEELGLGVRREEGGRWVVELHKGAVLKNTTLKNRVSKRLVEAKRGQASYGDVIDGVPFSTGAVEAVPQTPSLPSAGQAAFFFPPSSSSAPAAAGLAAPPSLASRLSATAGSSPVPTPIPTPPPGASPFGGFAPTPSTTVAAAVPGLNAAASPFVPSFGLPPPAKSAAPAPLAASAAAFPSSSSTTAFPSAFSAPPSAGTACQTAAPVFSFAPSAAAAPPPPLPPSTAPPSSVPTFFSSAVPAPPAAKPLPPSSLSAPSFVPSAALPVPPSLPPASFPASTVPPVPAPASASHRFPPSLIPNLAHAPAPSASHPSSSRRVSASLTSPSLSKSTASHITSAQSSRRAHLVSALSTALTNEFLQEFVAGPVRRASTAALKERWAEVAAREEREKEEAAARVRGEMELLLVREKIVEAKRREGERRRWVREWVRRTERRVRGRMEEEERAGRWRSVVRGIGRAEKLEREEEDGEEEEMVSSDWEEEEEEGGKAGGEDVEFDLGGLTLGAGEGKKTDRKKEAKTAEERDWEMAERLRKAAATRARIWARGTFLPPLVSLVSSAISSSPTPLRSRPTWTTLLVSPSPPSPFANWLSCKFNLDAEEKKARRETQHARVDVRVVGRCEEVEEEEKESTGLVVFDCTKAKGEKEFDWPAARTRLSTHVQQITSVSLFSPAVLVILCPDRTLSPPEEAELRLTVNNNLNLPGLPDVSSTSVYIAHLDGAEKEFEAQARKLLGTGVKVREERVKRGLSGYLDPLLSVWSESMSKSYAQLVEESSAPLLVSAYLDALRAIIDETEQAAVPPRREQLVLPFFPTNSSSFRSSLESYITLPAFSPSGNFPGISTVLAQRPPVSDLILARLLLEHLAAFISSSLSSLSTREGTLTTSLSPSLARVATLLDSKEGELREAVERIAREQIEKARAQIASSSPFLSAPSTPRGQGKKRRASATPSEAEVSSPKKPLVHLNGLHGGRSLTPSPEKEELSRVDRLGALEGLLKDARALLAR